MILYLLLIIKIIGFTMITHNKPQMPVEAICILSLSSLSNRSRKKIKICQIIIPKNIIKIFSIRYLISVFYMSLTPLLIYIYYIILYSIRQYLSEMFTNYSQIKLYGPMIGPQLLLKISDGYYKLHKDLLSADKKFVHYVN